MAVATEVIEKLNQLDLRNMQSAMRYIDFLIHEQQKEKEQSAFQFDCWKGQLEYIADDFDDELDVFEDYK